MSFLSPKMAESAAAVLGGHGAEEAADAPSQEEASESRANRSSNASEGLPQDSQVPAGEEEEEEEEGEEEEDGRAPKQVYKRPAAKTKAKKMTMSEVQQGLLVNNSKLAQEISKVRKRKEELRKERQQEAKKEKATARQVKRLKDKALNLSNNDLMEVFLFRKEQEEKRNHAEGAASSNSRARREK